MNSDVSNASRIYADSNTLIYLVEGSPEFLPFAEKLFRYAGEQGIALVTSEITIAECLHGAHRQGSEALAEEYREVFRDLDVFRLVPIVREILERAAKIGAEQKLKLIDAFGKRQDASLYQDGFDGGEFGEAVVIHLAIHEIALGQGGTKEVLDAPASIRPQVADGQDGAFVVDEDNPPIVRFRFPLGREGRASAP
jgi:predicted nucleic acid-binding protein